jgi:hypothetical protein
MTDQDQINALNQTEAERVRWMTVAINAWSEINALKAQVNYLRNALEVIKSDESKECKGLSLTAEIALGLTPAQCLDKVKAKAIEEAANSLSNDEDYHHSDDWYINYLLSKAKQLRE